MTISGWLVKVLRRGLWLCRPKYLCGVFPICIDTEGRVLLIRKRLGLATGWQLPGGAKEYGVPLRESACAELRGETGLIATPNSLVLVRLHCVESDRDMTFAYLVHKWTGELRPLDTTEIAEARWVPLMDAFTMLYAPHRPMLACAINEVFRATER